MFAPHELPMGNQVTAIDLHRHKSTENSFELHSKLQNRSCYQLGVKTPHGAGQTTNLWIAGNHVFVQVLKLR